MFKWLSSFFANPLGDYRGVQNNAPTTTPIDQVAHRVNADSSIQVSAVWACVDLLSRTMASMPIDVYLVDSDGARTVDTKCNLHFILNKSPNYSMTPFEFWQTMTMQWALRGNAYALISRDVDGNVKSITPLNPDQMIVSVENGRVKYTYQHSHKVPSSYPSERILHWKCMGNGIVGLSKIDYMRASLKECFSTQENAIDMYINKGKMKGILTADKILNSKQKVEIAEQFENARQGGTPVLPADLHFQQLGLSPADTQLLETRRFSIEEISRWYGVPSALINSDGGASGANIEQVTSNFFKSTILPMCRSAEQALMKRVASPNEKHDHVVRFRLAELNKANDRDRFGIYAQGVQNGLLTRNEVRAIEDLPPIEGGDELTVQTNLLPINRLGEQNISQVPQKPITTEPIKQ